MINNQPPSRKTRLKERSKISIFNKLWAVPLVPWMLVFVTLSLVHLVSSTSHFRSEPTFQQPRKRLFTPLLHLPCLRSHFENERDSCRVLKYCQAKKKAQGSLEEPSSCVTMISYYAIIGRHNMHLPVTNVMPGRSEIFISHIPYFTHIY